MPAIQPSAQAADGSAVAPARSTAETPGKPDLRPRSWLLRHWHLPVAAVMLAIAYLTVHNHLPTTHSVAVAIRSANIRWIIVAVVCEAISLSMFACQQRALLAATGVRMSFLRALAVTYARSALAISLPAGSAVSAGFAFQQYRRSGATNDKAAAVTVLSGVVSFLGLGGLYVVGVLTLLAAEPSETLSRHPALIYAIGGAIVIAGVTWLITRRSANDRPLRPKATAQTGLSRRERIRVTIRQAIEACRSLRAGDWIVACSFAVANWLLDLLCLVSAARAFALPVGLFTIATMYLGIQIVRQLPITPGGIGLIETGLLAGLTHAGATAGAAAAAVLTYRMLSCWLIIPLGGLAWLGLRARSVATPQPDVESQPEPHAQPKLYAQPEPHGRPEPHAQPVPHPEPEPLPDPAK
jgi:putative heme transporter